MTIGNPNHPVTRQLEGEWHKILAIVMFANGLNDVPIREQDILELAEQRLSVVADARGGKLVIRLVDEAEGDRLVREFGGAAH